MWWAYTRGLIFGGGGLIVGGLQYLIATACGYKVRMFLAYFIAMVCGYKVPVTDR